MNAWKYGTAYIVVLVVAVMVVMVMVWGGERPDVPVESTIESPIKPVIEPTTTPMTCLEMRVGVPDPVRGTVWIGETVLCSEQWYLSNTFGPTLGAAVADGFEVIVRPWDGPVMED